MNEWKFSRSKYCFNEKRKTLDFTSLDIGFQDQPKLLAVRNKWHRISRPIKTLSSQKQKQELKWNLTKAKLFNWNETEQNRIHPIKRLGIWVKTEKVRVMHEKVVINRKKGLLFCGLISASVGKTRRHQKTEMIWNDSKC